MIEWFRLEGTFEGHEQGHFPLDQAAQSPVQFHSEGLEFKFYFFTSKRSRKSPGLFYHAFH